MQLYNTLTKTVEPLLASEVMAGERPFGLYSCGPTVQDVSHFGHARAALIPDLIRRILIARGIHVLHVRNITDVDDKIIDRANSSQCSFAEIAETYSRVYEQDMQDLNILVPHIVPRATGHIIEMIAMITVLIEKGFAYCVPSLSEAANTEQSQVADQTGLQPGHDVLFRVRNFPEYGRLSGRNIDDMRAGARVQMDDRKEDPADFALWKSAKPGEPGWPSPWGLGRPGWHIECSAMATKYLGEHIDLHTGGNDLVFPHHENEIAQAEAANGFRFAKHWVHNGMLNIDGEKMSKSLGNYITLREALDEYGGDVVRLYYLQHHYRSPASFSGERLEESRQGLERIRTFLRNNPVESADRTVSSALQAGQKPAETIALPPGVDAAIWQEVNNALNDDLNTPAVIAIVFELVRKGNSEPETAKNAAATVHAILELLGVRVSLSTDTSSTYSEAIDAIVALRTQVKQAKDFAMADQIRDALANAGIVIEDRREGPIWRVES